MPFLFGLAFIAFLFAVLITRSDRFRVVALVCIILPVAGLGFLLLSALAISVLELVLSPIGVAHY